MSNSGEDANILYVCLLKLCIKTHNFLTQGYEKNHSVILLMCTI